MRSRIRNNPGHDCPVRRRAGGFTLVEMTTSLAVAAVLFAALGSALVVATRAVPEDDDLTATLARTNRALQEFADELQHARYITEATATSITFVLPDRNRDGLPEVIRYAWGGNAGDALTRRANGGSAVAILSDVQSIQLTFTRQAVTQTYPGKPVEGALQTLSSHTSAAGPRAWTIDQTHFISQHIRPKLPAEAAGWRIKEAFLYGTAPSGEGGEEGSEGEEEGEGADTNKTLVQLRTPRDDKTPTSIVLDEAELAKSDLLSTYSWHAVGFSKAVTFATNDTACLVLAHSGTDASGRFLWDDAAAASGQSRSSDSGTTWTADTSATLVHEIRGTILTPGVDQTLTRDHHTSARMTLTVGSGDPVALETNIALLNRPQELTAVWEADFEVDPRLIDLNMDGAADWTATEADAFGVTHLVPPVWSVTGEMHTSPVNDFTEPVTVDVRMEDVTDEGEGGGVFLHVDRSGDTYAHIRARTNLQPDGTQTLDVTTYDTNLAFVTVYEQAGFRGPVEVQILVDPAQDSFNLKINGTDRGTYAYGRITAAGKAPVIGLDETAASSGTQIDHIRVRLGGTK